MNEPSAVRPYRLTPLLSWGVPSGFVFDERTGTLRQAPTPPVTPDPSLTKRVNIKPENLCAKCSEHECICNDGVYVNGHRQNDPKVPDYIRNLK